MYEFLDDDLKQVQMLGIADFKVQLETRWQAAWPRR
jgi:hypothetical protein